MMRGQQGEESVIIEYNGSIIRARKEGSLYRCPYCNALFYTPKDLLHHIVAHAKGLLNAQREPASRWH